MMDYLQFGLAHPVFAGCALVLVTLCLCFVLDELADVFKAARGPK